jgi:hypothetical protein
VVKKFSDQRTPLNSHSNEQFSSDNAVRHLATDQLDKLELQFGRLRDAVHVLAKLEMGRDPDAYHSHLIAQYLSRVCSNEAGAERPASAVQILDLFDTMLGTNNQECEARDETFVSLWEAISSHLDDLATNRGVALQQWCYRLADESRGRVHAAQTAAVCCNEHLQSLAQEAYEAAESQAQLASRLRVELCEAENEANASRSGGPLSGRGKSTQVDPRVSKYFYTRLDEVVMRGVTHLARVVANVHVAAVVDRCREFLRELGQMAGDFSTEASGLRKPANANNSDGGMDAQALSALKNRLPEFTSDLEKRVFGDTEHLSQLLSSDISVRKELPERLRSAARSVIQQALRGIDVPGTVIPAGTSNKNDPASNRLTKSMAEAAPHIVTSGSGKRLLVVLPETKRNSTLQDELDGLIDESLNVVYDDDSDLVFCYEVEGLALREIADQVLDGRYDLSQVAERLHTRTDVDWSSL